MSEKELPDVALALNQLTSAQAARSFVVIALTLVLAALLILERSVPEELLIAYSLIIGSLFDTPTVGDRFTRPREKQQ